MIIVEEYVATLCSSLDLYFASSEEELLIMKYRATINDLVEVKIEGKE